MLFQFPDRPVGSVEELWHAILDLLPQLEPRVVHDVTIGTSSTAVNHGLGYVPAMVIPVPHADARVWRSAVSDATFAYFTASTSVACDFYVIGVAR